MTLNKEDIHQLESMGISQDEFHSQLQLLTTGTEQIELISPATVGNGILRLTDRQKAEFIERYNNPKGELQLVKFVPASGAASRMFKHLVVFQNDKVTNDTVDYFFSNLDKFPFYKEVTKHIPKEILSDLNGLESRLVILHRIFSENELDYGAIPKGMIPFHMVNGSNRTPFEEHFREAMNNIGDTRSVSLHFTVSLAYRDAIKESLKKLKSSLDNPAISLGYSLQSESSNTVALDLNDEIIREKDGQMFFRPGGHGSLLSNLNNLHTDLIFIRNIDNIVPVESRKDNMPSDRVMAGYLLTMKDRRDEILHALESNSQDSNAIEAGMRLIQDELKHTCEAYDGQEDKKSFIQKQLQRPMRVCGMVKNVGEPGGGPFKVLKNGITNLQIVESSQINIQDEKQKAILNDSTHFNPVDIVCSTRDHHGEKFDLMDFRDVETSFIAMKSHKGQDIKALEWPGLWNGGMFNWITFFVEIPLEDFNPVKTVNDLLRENHLNAGQ